MEALQGVRVLDFSTYVPGPLTSLLLGAAGAEIIKVEPPKGDPMRTWSPAVFEYLNRGKRSVSVDLHDPEGVRLLRGLIPTCDVLIEQFRPGVMSRFGLAYDQLHESHPKLIYCSITGFGQSSRNAGHAGHDLTYQALAGSLWPDRTDVPTALVADIGGGALPAVMNIVLALRTVERTGVGCHLDVSIADNILIWHFDRLLASTGEPFARVHGGSPRYAVYRTADGKSLAAAPLEEKFWVAFCDIVGVPVELRDDRRDPEKTYEAVATRIAARPMSYWQTFMERRDFCCTPILSPAEAAEAAMHRRGWGDWASSLRPPNLWAPALKGLESESPAAPALGEHNRLLFGASTSAAE